MSLTPRCVIAIDYDLVAKIASPIITLIGGAIITHYQEHRSRVISYVGHVSQFTLLDANKTRVFTHSIVVKNAGRKSAQNVRLGHHIIPDGIDVFPPVQYMVEKTPSGTTEIIFPTLVPKEQITVSYLYFPPVTWNQVNSYTKSDDGLAKIITVIPSPQPSKLLYGVVVFLMGAGASLIVYGVLKLAMLAW